ncbi:hypothetical protein M3676_05590 [Metabacillus litoralis]|nr:hypothetical protein [Metabacillus litoralis]
MLKELVPDLNTKQSVQNTSLTSLKMLENTWKCDLYHCIEHLKLTDAYSN